MENIHHSITWLQVFAQQLINGNLEQWTAPAITSFVLISAAEIGDKSQLVCMTLAARHRAWPVLWGAVLAFAFLNTLAVLFGASIASWLPPYLIASAVAILFAIFGIQSLLFDDDDENEQINEKSGHSIFFSTFVLITVAEFGDKTQLAVVALSSTAIPAAVWTGATIALASTTAVGVIAGRTLLQKIPITLLHRISALIFLLLAAFAAYKAYSGWLMQLT